MRDHSETTVTISVSDLDESGITLTEDCTFDISNLTTSTIDTSAFDDIISFDNDVDLDLVLKQHPVEFEDHMPDVAKVEDMCNDYPALAQAYENFKTIYAMVHQDWKGRQEKDDQFPF